eukprot:gene19997-biopygen17550
MVLGSRHPPGPPGPSGRQQAHPAASRPIRPPAGPSGRQQAHPAATTAGPAGPAGWPNRPSLENHFEGCVSSHS